MILNEEAIAFEDAEHETFKKSYFLTLHNIMDVLKLKIVARVYEQSQSSYQSKWFVVVKKNKKLGIVHDLQPLNKITI
jgi:hypothetical protein